MSLSTIVYLMRGGVMHVLMLAAPVLGAALVIGLIVAIFQATTSIQEQTLTFLPKMLIMLVMIAVLGTWMFTVMQEYTLELFRRIPEMAR